MELVYINPHAPLTPENQELHIAGRLQIYASVISSVWSAATMYTPASDRGPGGNKTYDFQPLFPDGQCGPTDFLGGMILAWYSLADPEKDEIFYEEGSLLESDSGNLLSDHHAWIRVIGKAAGKEWRIDLAAGQPTDTIDPNGRIQIVMQGVNHRVAHIRGINEQGAPSMDPIFKPSTQHALDYHEGRWGYWYKFPTVHVPNAETLRYEPEQVTSFKDYDASLFGGRLEIAAIRYFTLRYRSFGWAAFDFDDSNIWFPRGYDLTLNPKDHVSDLP